jgi:hypothetical protein
MVRCGTDDSTKTAGICRSVMKSARPCTSEVLACDSVLMPWRPRTSKP